MTAEIEKLIARAELNANPLFWEYASALRAMQAETDRLRGERDGYAKAWGEACSDAMKADARAEAALEPAEAGGVPAWLSNCVVCGRIVDTREKDEGGDGHGCEYKEGWTCSSECAEKLHPDPDWMKDALAAEAGGVEAQERAKALAELALADAPLIDLEPHVNETPKSEHDAGDVLTSAPDAVDALVKAADQSFFQLIVDGMAEAERAMRKFPQPNYVISKVAEEAGEVVKAAIHCAENRETAENVRGEMRQLIAMLYRLWVEGDQVHGLAAIREGRG